MNILLPVAIALVAFAVALRFYPRYIARVFGEDDSRTPPSERLADGVDYVKSRTQVVFAHHFATIAGAGPIVGPTLALAYGWQPVWAWIVIGGIFFGAVQDMATMFASLRENGRSVVDVARRTLGPVGYLLMLLVLLFVASLVNGIFLNLSVTALTSMYPATSMGMEPGSSLLGTTMRNGVEYAQIGGIATTSVFIITLLAPILGVLLRRNAITTTAAYNIGSVICLGSVVAGFLFPINMSGDVWRWVLTGYLLVACAVPIWLMIQPRDFANVQILYAGTGLLLIAVVVGGFNGTGVQAPAVDLAAGEAALRASLWPILFVTVACGAISGFHSLVSSGTTVKQLPRESDVRRVGYGAMLTESVLAILVLMAVASMLSPAEYFSIVYPADAPSNPVLGFALASGRLINAALPFVPVAVAVVIGILMLEGFVVTTLDSSVRLCRMILQEFWQHVFRGSAPAVFRSAWLNTALAVSAMLFFALNGGVRDMWPVFGAGNQVIAALALTTVTVWLVQRGRDSAFTAIPAVVMIVTTSAALYLLMETNLRAGGNTLLGITSGALLFLAMGVVVVGVSRFFEAVRAEVRRPLVTE